MLVVADCASVVLGSSFVFDSSGRSSSGNSSDDSLGHDVGRVFAFLRESASLRLWLRFPFVASLNFLLLVECRLSLLSLLELCSWLGRGAGAVLELALAV